MKNEFGLIKKISSLLTRGVCCNSMYYMGIGDDTAVIPLPNRKALIVSTDSFVEEIHFTRKWSSFYEAGIKAASGAISDMYAMGGSGDYLFSAISVPLGLAEREILKFYKGMKYISDLCGAVVAGGDTVRSPSDHFSATITVCGVVDRSSLKMRSMAKAGDIVYLTGSVGMSESGLRLLMKEDNKQVKFRTRAAKNAIKKHIMPLPCLKGELLGREKKVHAMIDISDGLSSELWHIAESSGVQIEVEAEKIGCEGELKKVAQLIGESSLSLALKSGEEYELLFTASPDWKPCCECFRIGVVKKKSNRPSVKLLQTGTMGLVDLARSGYNHLSW